MVSSIQRVIVSYSAPPTILSSTKWQQVQSALKSQLPLRNMHWKPPSRSSIRTIQELDVDFVHLDTLHDEHTQIPVTILEKPLLNIYIVAWPNNDVEGYRNIVKKQIKDWHSLVTTRKHQEWLILHVVRPDKRPQGGTFFQLSSVFEKIRADFNTEKRERCVQVAWSSETDGPTVWAEFFIKIKDSLLLAFDSAVSQREDEVKRSESQRQMPGWNFCTFFILKESLAKSFEGVTLYEDAYAQYEELEISFDHVVKERNLSWFGNLINPLAGDDTSPLLDPSKKPYRDLIVANTISIFDFRIYVLSRQCELLSHRGRLIEVVRKSEAFLAAFGRRLRDIERTLPRYFIESWIYSSCLSVIEYCDKLASEVTITSPKLESFNAAKGELFELARNQLDILGVDVGHLPSQPPFSRARVHRLQPDSQSQDNTTTTKISNSEIMTAIDHADSFYELYVDITNLAISMYTKSGRKKFALRLHESLAALDSHRGRFESALAVYNSLPAHYASHSWNSLEAYTLSRALDTHASLGQDKNNEWIHILLAFLKTYVESLSSNLLIHEEDKVAYISGLVDNLRIAAEKVEADMPFVDHPAVSVHVAQNARTAETRDGCFLDTTILNRLPCALQADEISLVIAGRELERYKFTSFPENLPPGKTRTTLFCPAVTGGTYILESSELRVARLCFRWNHRTIPSNSPCLREQPVLVRVPKDLLALNVQLTQPTRVELAEPSALLLALSTGRNKVLKAVLTVASPGITFHLREAYLSDKKESMSMQVDENAIILSDIPEDTTVSILVPHSDTSTFQAMKVSTEVSYTTVPEPETTRKICITRVVLTALPISVNVEDFFRGTRLFSKFTISTTSHQHVRICDAQLSPQGDGLEGLKIVSCSTQNRDVRTVTPAQPVNFLFHIDSANGPVREPLNLRIKYRMLREEVEYVLEAAVLKILKDTLCLHRRVAVMSKLVEALERDAAWVELYRITGELHVPETARDGEEEEDGELLAAAKQILSERRHPNPPEGKWRELIIPVDMPYMNIVAAACVRILSTPFSDRTVTQGGLLLYAGQPISAALTILTSFHWGSYAGEKDRQYMLRYDMEEVVKDWLVSGPKRGDFIAMDGATHHVLITLIALHHGELALPKVVVTALPVASEATLHSESMAVPSLETYQIHGAEKVLILPREGRTTFTVGMGLG